MMENFEGTFNISDHECRDVMAKTKEEQVEFCQKVFKFANKNCLIGVFERLCELNIDVNLTDSDGRSLIQLAVYYKHLDIIKCLHRNGANIHVKDKYGWTALHFAAVYTFYEIVHYLITSGANIQDKNVNNETPLILACQSNRIDIIQYLVLISAEKASLNPQLYEDINYYLNNNQKNENTKRFVVDLMRNIKRSESKFRFDNSLFYKPYVDDEYICKNNQRNPHIQMLGLLGPECSHNICFRCAVNMVITTNNMVCDDVACGKIYEMSLESILNATLVRIDARGIRSTQQCLIRHTLELKDRNESINETVTEVFKYLEEDISIRTECMKIELDQLKFKFDERINILKSKILKKHKLPSCKYPAAIIHIINKFTVSNNVIQKVNIGAITSVGNPYGSDRFTLCSSIEEEIINFEKIVYFSLKDEIIENQKHKIESLREKELKHLDLINESDSIIHFNNIDKTKSALKCFAYQNKTQLEVLLKNRSNVIENKAKYKIISNPTEYEIKAFNFVKYGSLDEFKLFFDVYYYRIDVVYLHHTLLFEAVVQENIEFVKYFIDNGADVNICDQFGRNVLQMAILHNNREAIDLLKDCDFETIQLKKLLLGYFTNFTQDDLTKSDSFGATMLHYIASLGDIDLLERYMMALEAINLDIKGLDYEKRDNKELTCVERAAQNCHLAMVEKLMSIFSIKFDYSKDIVKSIFNKSLRFSKKMDVIKWFLNDDKIPFDSFINELLLFWIGGTSYEIIIEKIELLISKGVSLRIESHNGNSLLMHFLKYPKCRKTTKKLAQFMVAKGLDLSHRNKINQNAAHLAAINGNYEVLLYLFDHISVNEYDSHGWTPMMYAIKGGHIEIVKWLLNNLNPKSNQYEALQYISLMYGHNNILEILCSKCSYSVKVNKLCLSNFVQTNVSYFQFEALNIVKTYEEMSHKLKDPNIQILTLIRNCPLEKLVESDILTNRSDENGISLLHLAATFGRNDIILWFYVNDNFKINVSDKLSLTPLFYAALNGNVSTVLLLHVLGITKFCQEDGNTLFKLYTLKTIYFKEFSINSVRSEFEIAIKTISYVQKHVTTKQQQFLKHLLENSIKSTDEKSKFELVQRLEPLFQSIFLDDEQYWQMERDICDVWQLYGNNDDVKHKLNLNKPTKECEYLLQRFLNTSHQEVCSNNDLIKGSSTDSYFNQVDVLINRSYFNMLRVLISREDLHLNLPLFNKNNPMEVIYRSMYVEGKRDSLEIFIQKNGVREKILTFRNLPKVCNQNDLERLVCHYVVESSIEYLFHQLKNWNFEQYEKKFHFDSHNISALEPLDLNDPYNTIIKYIKFCKLSTINNFINEIEKLERNELRAHLFLTFAAFDRYDIILYTYLRNPSILDTSDKYGYTALQYAASNKNLRTVILLKSLGLNSLNKHGTKPIFGHFEKVSQELNLELLLQELSLNDDAFNYLMKRFTKDDMINIKSIFESILDPHKTFVETMAPQQDESKNPTNNKLKSHHEYYYNYDEFI